MQFYKLFKKNAQLNFFIEIKKDISNLEKKNAYIQVNVGREILCVPTNIMCPDF